MQPATDTYFDTAEYKALQAQRDNLFYSPGRFAAVRADIRLIDQKIADGRWHHENPGKTGSWRIATGGQVEFSAGIPRFETEADALAYIAAHQTYGRATAVYLRSRQTIEADLRAAGMKEAA
ncbi:hypothetical protein [Enterovirga rhinocerotis]|uniref:hypothetical protein n=1 Tax=Enterovirga rhinocerotis TaxID=1339210 RepID=UPI00105BDD7A|nr:hypothetical protein [Enterovirga rhinocerotis]